MSMFHNVARSTNASAQPQSTTVRGEAHQWGLRLDAEKVATQVYDMRPLFCLMYPTQARSLPAPSTRQSWPSFTSFISDLCLHHRAISPGVVIQTRFSLLKSDRCPSRASKSFRLDGLSR